MLTGKFVICIRNDGSDDLQLRRIYQVLPDNIALADGYLRVIDDSGEDYLYPLANFVTIDLSPSVAKVLLDLPLVPA